MSSLSGFPPLVEGLPHLTHPDGSTIRALVVEDDPALADLVAMGIRKCGWESRIAGEGYDAVQQARNFAPDVLVLDRMLPGLDGVEVLARIRRFHPEVPALFLTAMDSVQDRIGGLVSGGDDYVTKPFSIQEVLVRLHRLIQRSGTAVQDTATLIVGDLVLNVDTRDVTRGGDRIELTPTQFELLRYLAENPRRVLSKTQILNNVWHDSISDQGAIVELYISYLRKRIDAGRQPMIHTIRGAGYVIKPA